MSLSFKNAAQLDAPWTRWFFYGETGSGKTSIAASFPDPVFIVPVNEGSIVTLRGRDIPYYESCDMSSQVRDGVGGLNRILDELERNYVQDINAFPFQTIVLDSLTHYSELVVEEISESGTKQMDPKKWGEVGAHFRNVHSRLCNMQVHVVYTALSRIDKNDAGVVIAGPFLSGAAAIKLPSACEVVGYCEATKVKGITEYRTHFKKCGFYPARTRFGALPDVIQNFDFAEVQPYLTKTNATANNKE
jgi:hypothetical protein